MTIPDNTAGLEPYVPLAIHYEQSDILEYVARDVPSVAQPAAPNLDVLLDMASREPLGWRIYGWSRIQPTPPADIAGVLERVERFRSRIIGIGPPDLADDLHALTQYVRAHLSCGVGNTDGSPQPSSVSEEVREKVELPADATIALQSAVDLGRAMMGAKLDNEAPPRITLSNGEIVTGEVAEAFEALAEAVIDVGELAKRAISALSAHLPLEGEGG